MRKFNHNGLLLCEYQAKIFEKSYELDYSSPIFMRRFLFSLLSKKMDEGYTAFLSLDVNEGIESINEEYKTTSYGKDKYSKASLFWMGYMYRYICYTREEDTSFVMKLFKHKQMNSVYYVYHTQDPEWAIANLLEINGLDEKIFDRNYRLKMVMKKSGKFD